MGSAASLSLPNFHSTSSLASPCLTGSRPRVAGEWRTGQWATWKPCRRWTKRMTLQIGGRRTDSGLSARPQHNAGETGAEHSLEVAVDAVALPIAVLATTLEMDPTCQSCASDGDAGA